MRQRPGPPCQHSRDTAQHSGSRPHLCCCSLSFCTFAVSCRARQAMQDWMKWFGKYAGRAMQNETFMRSALNYHVIPGQALKAEDIAAGSRALTRANETVFFWKQGYVAHVELLHSAANACSYASKESISSHVCSSSSRCHAPVPEDLQHLSVRLCPHWSCFCCMQGQPQGIQPPGLPCGTGEI